MAVFRCSHVLLACLTITAVVSQQSIVSVDEIEEGGTFSVTCDVSRLTNFPSNETDISNMAIWRQTSQDTDQKLLANYFSSGLNYANIPRGREWTVEYIGDNGGTNNRNTMKIVIQVKDAVCQDVGVYECHVEYRGDYSSSVSRPQCVTSKSCVSLQENQEGLSVVSLQPIVSVDEIEDGGTFSVTCDVSHVGNFPSNVNDIIRLLITRQTSQDTDSVRLAYYYSYGSVIEDKYIPPGREWTVEFTGYNNGTNNRNTMKLVLQVSDAVCQDVGVYGCEVGYQNALGGTLTVSRLQCLTSKCLCPKDFCKNGGACVGLYTCDCSSTDFFGPTCQDTREEIPINDYFFVSIDSDNNIVVTSSGNLTFQGSVTLRRQDNKVSLVIPVGSYVTLDGPVKTSCLGDIDTCTSGFTITITHSFSSVSSTETLVALTTGAHLEAGVKGVSLYYESGNVNCYVVTSTQEWSIVQKFTLIENKWYNMTVSWHVGQGLDLLLGNDVIGSDITPDKLPVKATDERPILIGSETKTTSNSEMNLEGILTSPVFWREIQRAGIYFTKEPSSESSALEIAQIVGIAVGCFAALVFSTVAVVGLVYYIRRTSKDTPQTRGVTPGVKPEDDGYVTPIDYAYSMSTSNTHNNSNSQEYETFSHYDYITDDYLTLEPETTFNNSAPVLPNPRGSIENTYDRRVIDTGNPEEAT